MFQIFKNVVKYILVKTALINVYYFLVGSSRSFNELSLIQDLLRKDVGVMLDVGAHYGESATPFLSNGWSVFSFEPDLNIKKSSALEKLLDKYKGKYSLSEDAVTDHDNQIIPFYVSDESTGISSVISFTSGHRESRKVKTITLKTFLDEKKIDDVDFLKIDTEGNDLMVLKGFPFDKIQPSVILCEFEDTKTEHVGYNYKDLGDYLLEKGYVVYLSEWYPIVRYGGKHRWRGIKKYPVTTEEERAWGNYIAVAQDRVVAMDALLNKL